MGKRNRDRSARAVPDDVLAADQFVEGQRGEKARDGKASDGNEQPWTNERQLGVQPFCTVGLLYGAGNEITASARAWPGKAARDRGDVDAVSRPLLIETGTFEPAEERLPRATGKWLSSFALDLARCLSHEHRARATRERDDGPHRFRVATATTRGERRAMLVERLPHASHASK